VVFVGLLEQLLSGRPAAPAALLLEPEAAGIVEAEVRLAVVDQGLLVVEGGQQVLLDVVVLVSHGGSSRSGARPRTRPRRSLSPVVGRRVSDHHGDMHRGRRAVG
jgi:hypothetical protein